MGLTVGIDLGTTNSVISRIDSDGRPVVIPNLEGSPVTPSVVCFRGREVLVGAVAKELQAIGEWPVAAFFKRQMGDPLFIFHAGGRDYTATELSSLVLRKLKEDAQAYVGEAITSAVITVPAYFKDVHRKATIAAGEAVGLEVLQVVNEPTAAAIAYVGGRRSQAQRMLVYDLGGGTFDVTLLNLTPEEIRVRTSDGDHQLGGRDWDDRVVEYLAEQFRAEFGVDPLEDALSVAELLVQAEDAKRHLTSLASTTLTLAHGGYAGRYTLSRAKFEEITADLMERSVALVERVLSEMKLGAADIDCVLLVGGSTRMPMVHRYVAETFGRPPMGGINVDEAVALGAAILASDLSTQRLPQSRVFSLPGAVKAVDVTNHSLGMIAVNAERTAYVNSLILPKNAAVPCTDTRPYQHRTRVSGDNQIEVFMTQGETESPRDICYVGRCLIHDVPHQPGGVTIVEVTYHYDAGGTIRVSARPRGGHRDLRVTVEEVPADVPARFLLPPDVAGRAEPQHVTVYLAFDLSGSMSGEPLVAAKAAAQAFLANVDLSHCSVGVIAFSDAVKTKLKATQNARRIAQAIEELRVGETGGGNSGHPFDELHSLLTHAEGPCFGVVLADGVWSNQRGVIERAQMCHSRGIEVVAIGFGSADRAFLSAIASSEEGSIFTSLGGLVETFSTIAQVLTEAGGCAEPALAPPGLVRRGRLRGTFGVTRR